MLNLLYNDIYTLIFQYIYYYDGINLQISCKSFYKRKNIMEKHCNLKSKIKITLYYMTQCISCMNFMDLWNIFCNNYKDNYHYNFIIENCDIMYKNLNVLVVPTITFEKKILSSKTKSFYYITDNYRNKRSLKDLILFLESF